jgi:hypothetical protein
MRSYKVRASSSAAPSPKSTLMSTFSLTATEHTMLLARLNLSAGTALSTSDMVRGSEAR